MVIRIKKDRIEFDNFTLRETSTGFTFDGQITADGIVQNFATGSNFGFVAGGGAPVVGVNNIDKISFASDENATDHGDLVQIITQSSGTSSQTHGYVTGGYTNVPVGSPTQYNTIQKFPFASSTGQSDVGDISPSYSPNVRRDAAGQTSSTHGYHSGGTFTNSIGKFPFAMDTNSSSVGSLTLTVDEASGQSSSTSGYTSGGQTPPFAYSNTIQKFPFSNDYNSTNTGALIPSTGRGYLKGGIQSTTKGYICGGENPGVGSASRHIISFPFASDTTATLQSGLLSAPAVRSAGVSATSFGYNIASNSIDKFSFTSDNNATDIGNLVVTRNAATGHQH